eukprot:3333490-Pleurochrysis_carterae.AAC.1
MALGPLSSAVSEHLKSPYANVWRHNAACGGNLSRTCVRDSLSANLQRHCCRDGGSGGGGGARRHGAAAQLTGVPGGGGDHPGGGHAM